MSSDRMMTKCRLILKSNIFYCHMKLSCVNYNEMTKTNVYLNLKEHLFKIKSIRQTFVGNIGTKKKHFEY